MVLYIFGRHTDTVIGDSDMASAVREQSRPDLYLDYGGASVIAVLHQFQNGSCMVFDALATPRQHGTRIDREVFGHFGKFTSGNLQSARPFPLAPLRGVRIRI